MGNVLEDSKKMTCLMCRRPIYVRLVCKPYFQRLGLSLEDPVFKAIYCLLTACRYLGLETDDTSVFHPSPC